jgi:hypothetical protein
MENLRDILRDAIAVAKQSGIWQKFTLREKEDVVKYFYRIQTDIRASLFSETKS